VNPLDPLRGAAKSAAPAGSDAAVESRAARAEIEFRAMLLRALLRPLTDELLPEAGGPSAQGAGASGFGTSGADMYGFFLEEALAEHLATRWPLPTPDLSRPPEHRSVQDRPSKAAIPLATEPIALARRPEEATLPEPLEGQIQRAARLFALPDSLVRAVVMTESGGRADAVSPQGAVGLMQVMPGTAREMGVRDLQDPWENLYAGAKYLRRQIDRFGNLTEALTAYNAGPGAVERHGGVPPYRETRAYVQKVLGWMRRFEGTE
jgi:hypothetical protein